MELKIEREDHIIRIQCAYTEKNKIITILQKKNTDGIRNTNFEGVVVVVSFSKHIFFSTANIASRFPLNFSFKDSSPCCVLHSGFKYEKKVHFVEVAEQRFFLKLNLGPNHLFL